MKKALIIVDMSNDFVADNGTLTVGKLGQDVVPYIIETANKFIKNGDIVVVTMDAHEENDKHFELWPAHNIVGTEGQKLYGELDNWYGDNIGLTSFFDNSDQIIYQPKTNYNAFFKTDLAEQLREKGVDEVHVVGVCTDICDFLTIAGADAEGFKTAMHKRGAATFTDNTNMILNHMKLCFHTQIIE
ncbi:MAG: isochorismatase [Bacillales bacterium]|nr:isochorismatase [Bacillales bacterium]